MAKPKIENKVAPSLVPPAAATGPEVDLTKQRMEKVAPLVKTILKMMADADLPVGDLSPEDNTKYADFAKSVLQVLLDNDLKYVDKDFLFQLMKQPVDQTQNIVLSSLARSFDTAINRALGKEFREVGLKDLDNTLRNQTTGN